MKPTTLAFAALFLLSGCLGLVDDVQHAVDAARVKARVAVLANLEISWPASAKPFEKALAFCRAEGVDAVVVVGDPTQKRQKNQYEVFESAFRRAFPEAARTGVPRLVVATNRVELEVKGFSFAAQPRRPQGKNRLPTFHGEGKLALTDGLCAYPEGWNSFCAGSMSGIDANPFYEPLGSAAQGRMKAAAQGLLVKAYADEAMVRRIDFASGEDVGEPWRVALAESDARAPRQSQVPEFWPDTRLAVSRGYGKNGETLFTVRWPNLLSRHVGVRAFAYDVGVETEGNPSVVRHVLSDDFFRAEAHDAAPVRLSISAKDIPSGSGTFRVSVTPVSSLGVRGKPVFSESIPRP